MEKLSEAELKMLLDLYENHRNPLELAIYKALKELSELRQANQNLQRRK